MKQFLALEEKTIEDLPILLTNDNMVAFWGWMAQGFGNKWISNASTKDHGGIWRKALRGITPISLVNGFEACLLRSDPWPPSAPEFRAICLNIPSDNEMVQDVLQGKDTIGATFLKKQISSWDLKNQNATSLRNMLQACTERAKSDLTINEIVNEYRTLIGNPENERETTTPAQLENVS